MAPFETVQKGKVGTDGPPQVKVYQDGTARLTATADRRLGQPDAVKFRAGTGGDAGYLQIVPADSDDPETYSCSRNGNQAGADLNTTVVMRDWVGVDLEALEETHAPSIEITDEMVIADCRDLPGVDAGDSTETTAEDDSDDTAETDTTEATDDDVQAAVGDGGTAAQRPGDTVTLEEPDTAADLVATAGAPWEDHDDRDARVEAFVGKVYEHNGGPFRTKASRIAEKLDENSVGVSYSLKALAEFDAEKVTTDELGTAIWEITKTEDIEDTEESPTPDPATNGQAPDQTDDQDLAIQGVISAEGEDGVIELPADEVVDAIATAENVHDVQAALGLDRFGVRALLREVDMLDMLATGEDGIHQDVVRETIEGYLEEAGV